MALARLFPIDVAYAQDSDTAIGRIAFPCPKSPKPKHPQNPQKSQRIWWGAPAHSRRSRLKTKRKNKNPAAGRDDRPTAARCAADRKHEFFDSSIQLSVQHR